MADKYGSDRHTRRLDAEMAAIDERDRLQDSYHKALIMWLDERIAALEATVPITPPDPPSPPREWTGKPLPGYDEGA